jgi:hypothetical protein
MLCQLLIYNCISDMKKMKPTFYLSISAKIIRFSVPFICYCIIVGSDVVMFRNKRFGIGIFFFNIPRGWLKTRHLRSCQLSSRGVYIVDRNTIPHAQTQSSRKIIFFASYSMSVIIAQASFFWLSSPIFAFISPFFFPFPPPMFPHFSCSPSLLYFFHFRYFLSAFFIRLHRAVSFAGGGGAYFPTHTYCTVHPY